MAKKQTNMAELNAAEYLALTGLTAASAGWEFSGLLALAEARAAPCLTKSLEQCRLESLVSIVREQTIEKVVAALIAVLNRDESALPSSADVDRLRNFLKLFGAEFARLERRSITSKGGVKRQSEMKGIKEEVRQFWLERQAGKHRNFRTDEQFAIACQRQWPKIKSTKTVTRWCTEWKKTWKPPSAS